MIKSKKLILISVLALVAAVCLFAGCKLNSTLDDFKDRYNLTARVTYFLNDGEFEDKTRIKEMYYTAGSKPFDISINRPSSGSAQLEDKHGSVFTGWFNVEKSADGNPLYADGSEYVADGTFDPTKGIQMTAVPFDFSKPLEEGDHYFVCGDWLEVPKLLINLALEDCDSLTDSQGQTYTEGATISETYITGDVHFPGKNLLTASGYTFISYYKDAACETPVTWPLVAPEDNDEDITIYAKYIQGNWTVVENTSGISAMFTGSGGTRNYYFLNDVDCTGLTVNSRIYFAGKIKGNNCTVSNLTVNGGMLSQNGFGSVFGDIEATAEIADITFADVTATFSIRSNVGANAYFVCKSIAAGAKISNFTVGGNVIVNLSDENSTLLNDTADTWLFGGFNSDSECSVIEVIAGTTCTINNPDGTNKTYIYNES